METILSNFIGKSKRGFLQTLVLLVLVSVSILSQPALAQTTPQAPCTLADIDRDDDGLIEICDLEGLNAIRHQLDGSGYRASRSATKITAGCAGGGCKGYELNKDLDFDSDASYSNVANKARWTTGLGWQPIGRTWNSFRSTFEGNGYTISNLTVNRLTFNDIGLFGYMRADAEIINVGLLDVDIQGFENVGGLVGYSHGSSVKNSYVMGSVIGDEDVGGLVGENRDSSIKNSYVMGSVEGRVWVGGLTGWNVRGDITNSYAAGAVKGNSAVGGLIGSNIGDNIRNSYWDKTTSRMSSGSGGVGKTTTELQSPTTATGIYSSWSTNNWDFGTREQYPVLKYRDGTLMPNQRRDRLEELSQLDILNPTSCSTADRDQDNDGLIEICNLEGLDAIRYQLDGSGYRASESATKITAGCAESGCKGYELIADLDFDDDASYSNVANKVTWTTGSGWQPIGTSSNPFNAIFRANKYSISKLMIARSSLNQVGLFGNMGSQARIEGVGLIDADVRGDEGVGGLVGYNSGGTIINSYVTGIVRGDDSVGGLVGDNYGPITNSYTNVEMSGDSWVGGIVGCNFSGGIVTNSYTVPRINRSSSSSGGLLGANGGSRSINSYWDKEVSGISSGDYGVGLTTAELQSPITSTGIYSRWSTNAWDFGSNEQYPALKYRDGTLMPNQGREIPEELPQIEIAGVPVDAVNEGERITLTASSTSNANNIPLIYQWRQTSGRTLLTSPTSGSSVTLDVPEDYVMARATTSNLVLTLGVSSDVGSNTQQISITIAKRNNGGIEALGVPTLNERELTAPSIDLSGDSDGGGNNIGYQWQSRQSAQTAWVNVSASRTNERYTIPADTAGVVEYRVVVSYTDGQGYRERVASEASSYKGNTIPSVEIAGVPVGAVNEGERITLTAFPHNSENNILPSYSWTQTLGKTLLTGPTSGSRVILDVPEDYVSASENTGNAVLILEASNDVGSTTQQVSITIAKHDNGGIAALGIPNLNERELTAPSIDLSGDPDGSGNNIRYQWQSRQSTQTAWIDVSVAGTNARYTIPADTAGIVEYRVVVRYTDGQGYGEEVLSGAVIYERINIASLTSCSTTDIDQDDDGLIEICDLEGLDAMRYQMDGSGYRASLSATKITAGCAEGGCKGYELNKDLDFDNDASYRDVANKAIWTTGSGWQPLRHTDGDYQSTTSTVFNAVFEGNNYTLSNLMINRSANAVGLFGKIGNQAQLNSVGLIDVDVRGNWGVGGLAGHNSGGAITNSYVIGLVRGNNSIGGLVGDNYGPITNSYTNVEMLGNNYVGGIVGCNFYEGIITNSYTVSLINRSFSNSGGLLGYDSSGSLPINSYWDKDVSGISSGDYGVGLTTEALQAPTTSTGIYSRWSIRDWDFGTREQYPALKYRDGTLMPNQRLNMADMTSCGIADIDQDNDGLIEICDLEGLSAMRYQKDGSGYRTNGFATKITTGCAVGGCKGYELAGDLDFSEDASYTDIANKATWTTGEGWEPIGSFGSIFDGNGYTISHLMINRSTSEVGLFGSTVRGAEIVNAGLLSVDVQGNDYVGGLVGFHRHSSIANSYAIGSVQGVRATGVLVGYSWHASITSSYAMGSVEGRTYVGSLVGDSSYSNVTNSYATGSVNGHDYTGGLVGDNWYSDITNSYAIGSVVGIRGVGGLTGRNTQSITNSYWDKTTSGMSGNDGGAGKTTTQLQSPTGATGIYSSWSTNDWDFGTREQYPALKYSDGTLMPNQGREMPEEPAQITQIPQVEIAGVPTGAVDEGERITLTASSTNNANNIPLIYQWRQTSSKTLLTNPTSGNSVTLNVPEDYVAARANIRNLRLTLRVSNEVGSTTHQVSITIAKRNNGGIAVLGVPSLNERELTAPSINLGGDPDGGGSNVGYQWQSRQSTQTAWIDVPTVANTKETYTIPEETRNGTQYRVVMSYTDGQGYREEVLSGAVIYERRVAPQPSIEIASLTSCGTADIDQDDDGLIEICNLEGLDAIRYQVDGSGYRASVSATKITAGCAEGGCKGYELNKKLDFDDDASYRNIANKAIWTTGAGWNPIGHMIYDGYLPITTSTSFNAIFEGNNHTISNLMIARSTNEVGLFGRIGNQARLNSVGLINVDVRGGWGVGGLAGYNTEGTITNSYVIGSVRGDASIGGLVGDNYGPITNSYTNVEMSGNNYVGGIAGCNFSGGIVTNSYTVPRISSSFPSSGGLLGYDSSGSLPVNSYWDKEVSGISSGYYGIGLTTEALQSPTTATGIYSRWSVRDWDFGTREQYPALKHRDGTLMPNQVRERPEEPVKIPQIEIAGVPTGAVDEGERIILTASSTSSANNISLIYHWQQTSGKTLLTSPTSRSRVTLDVPEDYVVASDNTGNVVLMLEAINDVGSTAQQVLITIAKSNNGGIAALDVPSLNERELTAPSIDLSGDPDGVGNNIRYQWQSKQSAQTEWVNVPAAGTNALYIIPADTAGIVQYRVVVSYTDGQGYEEQVESEASSYKGNTIPSVEIAGVPADAVNEGEQITLTASPHNSDNNILPSYSWTQTSGKTLLISSTSGSSVTLEVPEDYVVASENTGNVVLILEASNDVGSTAQQVLITIAKRNNGGIAALGVPSLNERELTAPSIDLSGDPDGIGSNIRYQWQSKQSAQTEWVDVPAAGTNVLYIIPANTAGVVQYRVVVSYTDGQGYEEQVESGTSSYKGNTIPSVEIAGVPAGAVNEGEQITLTASPHNSDNNILPSYSWTQTSGKTLLISSTSGSSVTLEVPEDYVAASENTGNVVLMLEASNDVGSTAQQVLITIAKSNNGGIAALGVSTLNERELTAPSIDLSGDPDGVGNNIRYQWQSRQGAQTEWVNVQTAGTNALYTIPADIAGVVQYRVVVSYTDGQGYEEQVESEASSYKGNTIPSVEIAGVPADAVNEGEQITLTASPHNSDNNILPSYSWTQTSGKTLLISSTSGSSVTLDVPEDYVAASENTGNVVLILEASNDVGSTAQQVLITIAKRNNGEIAALDVPTLNERELTAPSIDLSGDPDGIGSNIRYQWQSKQGAQTEWVNVQTAGTNALYIIPANTAGIVQYRVVVSYTDGQGYEEQIESEASSYRGNTIPSVEIAGVPAGAVNEGEQITLTASPHNSDNNILPSYSWTQTLGKTLLISPISGSSVTLEVPEDYVAASENTGNVMLILEASNDVGSTAQQVLITIAKRNNGEIAVLGVPTLNERELTAPSIDLSDDPDGSGNNIRYQWQSKQGTQTEWVNVPAAGTNALYIIPANTEGIVQYRVVVSYTDGQGYEEQVESEASSYRGNTSPSIEFPGSVRLLAGQTTAVSVVISEVDVSDVVTLTIELTSAAGTIHVEPNRRVLGAGLSETRTTQFQLTAEQVGSAKLLLTAVDDSQTVTDSSDAVELTVEVEVAPFTSCGYVDIDRDNDGLIEICNLEGLNAMRNQLFGISYKENVSAPEITTGCAEGGCKGYELVKDLDFNDEGSYKDIANKAIWTTGEGWQPIGVRGNGFGSIFEGNDNTISNLMIDRSLANNVGLFGVVDGQPKINGIGLLDVDINAQSRVGGLAGYITSGDITNSYVTGNVIGQLTVGGLVGQCSYSRVSNSYAIGRVEAMGTIGGIDAGSSSAVGGLVGYLLGSSVSRSHAIGSVKGVGDYAGGLIGSNTGRNGSIIASYAFVDVEGGNNYTGGLVGSNNGINNKISNSYAIGKVTGENVVGGLAGHNRSRNTITNSYSFSNVKGISQVGGLVGNNVGRIINSYAVGRVAGNVEQRGIGGLVGLGFTGGTNNSYWDKTTSGRATSVGGVGQTTAQLQAPTLSGSTPTEVYHGWSEEIWDFGTSKQYPALKYSDGTLMPDQRIGLLSLSALTTEEVSFIFNTEVFDYRLLIDSEVDAVQLLPTATRADANINIVSDSGFSESVASGNLSPAIPLSTTRTTIITIEVEFASGANRVYRITISRAEQSSPAQLVGVNAPFEHTIPMSVMMDSDNNMRKYEVVSMPSWLERIELKEGLMFSGTPEKDHMGTPSERTIEIRIDNGDGTTQMLSLVLQIDIPTTGTIKLIALPDGILQLDDKLKDDNGIEKKVYIWEHCPVGASAFSELEGVNGMSYELPSEGPYVEAGTAYRVRTTVIDSLGQRKEYTAQIELPQRAPPKPVKIRTKIFLEGFLK